MERGDSSLLVSALFGTGPADAAAGACAPEPGPGEGTEARDKLAAHQQAPPAPPEPQLASRCPTAGAPSPTSPHAPGEAVAGLLAVSEGAFAVPTAHGTAHAVAPSPPAPAAGEPPDSHVPNAGDAWAWRCLESTHEEGCTRCTPAPDPSRALSYKLSSPDGVGAEKRLRSLIAATPEWRSDAARNALADELVTHGDAGSAALASLLRRKNAPSLRKGSMLQLAHAWRYKSRCWVGRGEEAGGGGGGALPKRRKAEDAPAGDAPATLRPRPTPGSGFRDDEEEESDSGLPPAHGGGGGGGGGGGAGGGASSAAAAAASGYATVDAGGASGDGAFSRGGNGGAEGGLPSPGALPSVHASLAAYSAPLLATVHEGLAGRASRAAFTAAGGRGMTWARLHSVGGCAAVFGWFASLAQRRAASLAPLRASLGALPAASVEYAFSSPDEEVEAMRSILVAVSALAKARADASRAASPGGALPAADAAWLADARKAQAGALALLAAAQSCASSARLSSFADFTEAADAVLCALRLFSDRAVAALQERATWMRAMCEAVGPEAAGDRDAAFAQPHPILTLMTLGGGAPGQPLLALLPGLAQRAAMTM